MPDKDTVFPYDDEVTDPYAADDTKNPHEPTGDQPEPEEETEAAPKRRPGRPRKSAS